jgi:predicted nucleic acid-binding protein
MAAALIDTNVLVYRFDWRFPEKQRIATGLLRKDTAGNRIKIAHQVVVQFVA